MYALSADRRPLRRSSRKLSQHGCPDPLSCRHRPRVFEVLEDRCLLSVSPTIELFNASPALFVENLGQWSDPAVRYAFQGSGATVLQLLPIAAPQVRVAYVIPSNRTPQADGVANLQYSMEIFQTWYRDQMERNGFGPKTFVYETEPDGTTPLIHVVHVAQSDDYLRGDVWGRVGQAVADAGVPIWDSGQVWLLVPEIHVENADGSIVGGVDLGASNGSGTDPGVAMIGTNGMVIMNGADLVNNTPYNGLVIPDLGPYPLVQNVSFAWFEGSTLSSLSSTYLGATLHEMSHGFGLPHDFRNDGNFHGDLMGNGLRGMRGAIYPNLYPSDDTFLSYGQALALSTSRYFNPEQYAPETNSPAVSVSTTGSVVPTHGLLDISFAASDDTGLSSALLLDNGDQIGEMVLSGTRTTSTFETPYYTKGLTDTFTVRVYDVYGNRRDASVNITPATGFNAAPKPFVRLSTSTLDVGQSLLLNASSTSDPDDALSSLTVEWDLNGDGVFDTVPTTTKTLTTSFAEAGTRLIRARITDPHGAQSLSAPIGIRILGAPTDTTPPTISAFSVAPTSVTLGNSFTISYTVSDSGGSGLNRVELWRTNTYPSWPSQSQNQNSATGNGPVSGSFPDVPPTAGDWWYGMGVTGVPLGRNALRSLEL